MSAYLDVPPERLSHTVLQALLEEYASREGTDYGEQELTLAEKTGNLRRQLASGELRILYHVESEAWDLLPEEQAQRLLGDPPSFSE